MIPLIVPVEVLKQHLIVLGKTGSGKSTTLRHFVEWLLLHHKRVCIIDPKGDWWGLKWSADGKKPGFPVIAFGDFKEKKATDIPINPQAGKQVAELIVSGNRPCVIGLRGWMPGELNKFWVSFASTIFNSNEAGGLYVIIDEVQHFAPKERIGGGEENLALHWTKRLLSEGRGLGLTIMCGSQRPQSVHNGVLTQCETLIGMKVIHDADCSAVETWLKRCRDKEKRKEIMESIPEMARGEAWVWSPEIGFGPARLNFPLFETFDSFAPPQLQKKIHGIGWDNVDLEAVKVKLASVIEEQKAKDPGVLNKTISELRAKIIRLERAPAPTPLPPPPPEPKPFLTSVQEGLINRVADLYEAVQKQLDDICENTKSASTLKTDILTSLKTAQPKVAAPPAKRYALTSTTSGRIAVGAGPNLSSMPTTEVLDGEQNNSVLGKCARALLIAVAPYPNGRTPIQMALLSGYVLNSGNFKNSLGQLRSLGYVERGQPVKITQAGLDYLGNDYTALPTGQALIDHWLNNKLLGKCEKALLAALVQCYPQGMTPEELGEAAGYVINSGNFKNSIGRLRTLELVERGQPIKVSDNLFQ